MSLLPWGRSQLRSTCTGSAISTLFMALLAVDPALPLIVEIANFRNSAVFKVWCSFFNVVVNYRIADLSAA